MASPWPIGMVFRAFHGGVSAQVTRCAKRLMNCRHLTRPDPCHFSNPSDLPWPDQWVFFFVHSRSDTIREILNTFRLDPTRAINKNSWPDAWVGSDPCQALETLLKVLSRSGTISRSRNVGSRSVLVATWYVNIRNQPSSSIWIDASTRRPTAVTPIHPRIEQCY